MNFITKQEAKPSKTNFAEQKGVTLDEIKAGYLIKIEPIATGNRERFWAVVTNVDGDDIEAKVDNDLMYSRSHGLRLGDKVVLKKESVLDILRPE